MGRKRPRRNRDRLRDGVTPTKSGARTRAFTLTELMVAVAVLVVVILAAAKIFGTVSKVTGLGQATRDVMQEAAAIERQIRADFARLSPEGFFAIHCVAVPNDVHYSPTFPLLLNPNLPREAIIRADQIVFFTTGVEGTQVFADFAGSNHKQQSTSARIYYGHAFQLPNAEILGQSADPAATFNNGDPILPWSLDPAGASLPMFRPGTTVAVGTIDGSQPQATSWLLARQPILLADDGGGTEDYLSLPGSGGNSVGPIDAAAIRNGRRDIAASQLNDIRASALDFDENGVIDPWPTQLFNMSRAVFYPRAERVAPTMHRVDHALTGHVLATACSSFTVDWTYQNGVGDVLRSSLPAGTPAAPPIEPGWDGTFGTQDDVMYRGVRITTAEQPWFGLDPDGLRGVGSFHDYASRPGEPRPQTIVHIDPYAFEVFDEPGGVTGPVGYWAFFGYNQDAPLDPTTGRPWVVPATDVAFTPLPSAIRITMVLHDPRTKLENGRVVQFVIDLPKRVN